ncbi:hypothetical protein OCU04_004406 [Sclerotinia nivalis]|uniref:Uncharacterized protein n=1 Tax=Sclerotinia nivalis TaxID=352851 RepID=A0A9X0AQC3_9HELO|nr:hypothetical protein OCU04_004406 [Sclerotinia nivalis]
MASIRALPAPPVSSDTAGHIDGTDKNVTGTQTIIPQQSNSLVPAKIALAKPNLLNDADFESISQLPNDEVRNYWAEFYRRAHMAQWRQQKAWIKFTESIGTKIDASELERLHEEYINETKKDTDEMINLNNNIKKQNKEKKRDELYGQLVAAPFRGPQLEILEKRPPKNEENTGDKVDESDNESDDESDDESGSWDEDASKEHFQLVSAKLTSSQRDMIAPLWSLAAALMLHRNDLLQNPEYFNRERNTNIMQILKKMNGKVKKMFKSKHFRGTTKETWAQYENFGKIHIPKATFPAQRVYNVSREEPTIGNQNAEDDEDETEQESDFMSEDEPELVSGMLDAPPADVQALRANLGGWDGPLTKYFRGQLKKPVRDLYQKLIQPTDSAVAALYTGAAVEDTKGQRQNPYEFAYSIKKHLHILTVACHLLWRNPAFKSLNKGKSSDPPKQNTITLIRLLMNDIENSLLEAQLPGNFMDAMIPPTIKDLLEDKDSDDQDEKSALPTRSAVASNQNVDDSDVSMKDAPGLETDDDMEMIKRNERMQQYQKARTTYYTAIVDGDYLLRYINDPDAQIEAKRKIDTLTEEFRRSCTRKGFEADDEDILDDVRLEGFIDTKERIKSAQEAYLNSLKNDDLKLLDDLYKETADLDQELAVVVIGDPAEFEAKVKARKERIRFKPIKAKDYRPNNGSGSASSRFVTPTAWRSPPGVIIDNGIEKTIVGFRPVGSGEQLLLEWRNEGAERNAFELVASSVYKHKRKEYTGNKMEIGRKSELENYDLRDCGFGGVAQVRRRDTTTSYIRAPATYIFISHKGKETWFTKSDMIAVFGDQIKDAIEDYNEEAHQTQVTGNNAWKNSRHNGWKDSIPLSADFNIQDDDNDFVTSQKRRPTIRKSVVNSMTAEERKEYEEFKKWKENARTRAGRA